jgi:shingomyelin synthase
VLPAANPDYVCDPQLNHTISAGEVAHRWGGGGWCGDSSDRRVVKIISGFGLSINGQHVYCGDWIFSGHTMILILAYLIVQEYSPRRCRLTITCTALHTGL